MYTVLNRKMRNLSNFAITLNQRYYNVDLFMRQKTNFAGTVVKLIQRHYNGDFIMRQKKTNYLDDDSMLQ